MEYILSKDINRYLEKEVLFDVFNVTFKKDDVFYKKIEFDEGTITFAHINTDEIEDTDDLDTSRGIYDVVGDRGNPMITMITYNYHHGFIKPAFATIYGLKTETPEDRQEEFLGFIYEAIDLYNTHKHAI